MADDEFSGASHVEEESPSSVNMLTKNQAIVYTINHEDLRMYPTYISSSFENPGRIMNMRFM